MAIDRFARRISLPIGTQSDGLPRVTTMQMIIATIIDVINCARRFVACDLSDISKLIQFINLVDDLTEFKSDDPQQVARSKVIISSMYGHMFKIMVTRLALLAALRQLEQINGIDLNDIITSLRTQTRQEADTLIMIAEMEKNLREPTHKRPREDDDFN